MTAQALLTVPVLGMGYARPRPARLAGGSDGAVPRLTWVLCAALLLCGSILVSAATTTDADWWRLYFSRLGMMGDFSSLAFNGGLIVSGAIIAGSSWVLRVRLRAVMTTQPQRLRLATVFMPQAITGLGVSLLAIGAFPLSLDPVAHEWATNGAVLSFALLLLSHRVLLWQLCVRLQRGTVVSAVVLVCALAALKLEAISLTIFEAIAFAVILGWVHQLEHLVRANAAPQPVAAVDSVTGVQSADGHVGSEPPLALATTMPRWEVANPSSISRSSSAPTSAPNASAPGSSMIPDASDPAITVSNPRSSIRRDTMSRSAAVSPAIAIALRPGAPAGRASSSMSWYPMCPSPLTTRAPARCR